MKTIIRYVVLTASRDWLFIGLFAALLISFQVAKFLGNLAVVEEWLMSISLVAGVSRVVIVMGMLVFVCFHVRRAFENKEIDVMISRPISRNVFVISYWLGFLTVALMLMLPFFALVYFTLPIAWEGMLIWSLSIVLEVALVIAFALFASLILQSAVTSVLLTVGFYVAARLTGFFIYTFEKPGARNLLEEIATQALYVISSVMTRLDFFGKSEWLMYKADHLQNMQLFLVQAAIYIPLLLCAAIYDFRRKQF